MALLLTEAAKLSNDVVLLRRPLHNRHCRTPTPRHPRESGRVSSLPGSPHPCAAPDSLRDTGCEPQPGRCPGAAVASHPCHPPLSPRRPAALSSYHEYPAQTPRRKSRAADAFRGPALWPPDRPRPHPRIRFVSPQIFIYSFKWT